MSLSETTTHETTLTLRDGREILMRPALVEDLDILLDFFRELPDEDRNLLRLDVTDRAVVERRLHAVQDWGRLKRLVALDDGEVVATGVLELHDEEAGMAELRLIVARPYQRLGLGTLLARELYFLAVREDVDTLSVSYLAGNAGARRIFRHLGFRHEEIREGAGRDRQGNPADLVLARCPIQEIFEEMEHYIHDFDWRRSR